MAKIYIRYWFTQTVHVKDVQKTAVLKIKSVKSFIVTGLVKNSDTPKLVSRSSKRYNHYCLTHTILGL